MFISLGCLFTSVFYEYFIDAVLLRRPYFPGNTATTRYWLQPKTQGRWWLNNRVWRVHEGDRTAHYLFWVYNVFLYTGFILKLDNSITTLSPGILFYLRHYPLTRKHQSLPRHIICISLFISKGIEGE